MANQKKDSSLVVNGRNVIKQSPNRITGGMTVADAADEPLQRESRLEGKGIKQVICCADVKAVRTQQTICYVHADGNSHKYTPDMTVELTDGTERLIEVKPLALLLAPDKRRYYAGLWKVLQGQGRSLDFLTNDQLDIEPRQETADLLKRYRNHPVSEAQIALIQEALAAGPKSIRSILFENQAKLGLADLYGLVSQRYLFIDWSCPFAPESYVALPHSGFGGLSYDAVLHSGRYGLVLQGLVLGGGPETERVLAAEKARRELVPRSFGLDFF